VIDEVLDMLPVRSGHFLLESGYHANMWFTLDALFTAPHELAPAITALARNLAPYEPSAICGPLLGGAFLAQAIAMNLGLRFYYSEPAESRSPGKLFSATYGLPAALQQRVADERVALVDDVISAGSSVRATAASLTRAGASIIAVGTLVLLGTSASDYFENIGIPMEPLARRDFTVWSPDQCPLCQGRMPLEDPSLRKTIV
jgi:orotate phosphoribosyltransferase